MCKNICQSEIRKSSLNFNHLSCPLFFEHYTGHLYLFFTVLCRAPSFHWSILNNEIHLSSSRLYGMILVYGMAESCLYNKHNNTWTLGDDMEFIFSCSHSISHLFAALTCSISMWTLEDKFHISARPCFILYIYLITQYWFW